MRSFFIALLLLQLATSCRGQDCIEDLTTIFNAEVDVLPDVLDTPREYVLCPNQDYVTKIVREGVDASQVPGQLALFVRSGATVKCGDDGALSNNCSITEGTFGASIRYLPEFDSMYPKALNARMQGITFDGLESPLQIRGYNDGKIVFEDCLFTGTRSESPFILAGNEEVIPEGPDNPSFNPSFTRCDLTADPTDFHITFVNTTFENNEQLISENPSVFTTHFLLTTCPGQTLVFIDCVFQNNNFARDENTFETALVGSLSQQGAKAGGIILERTCFLNNSVLGGYPVRGESMGNDTEFLVSIDTYVDEASVGDNPLCEGFAIYNVTAEEKELLNCVEPGSSHCGSLILETPTTAPLAEEPTPAPLPCISNLSMIVDAEVNVPPDELDSPREYILCTHTEYDTKIIREGVDASQVPGQLALFVRSGATVKCGDDGALSNNCTITGGTFGASIRYLPQFDAMYPKRLNARMQGITFDGLESPLQIRGYNDGEIVFEDCLFTGTRSDSPFFLAGNEEAIPEGPDNPSNNPSFTRCDLTADPGDFNITFVNTKFENNEQLITENPSVFTTHFLLTTCPGQTLVFTDCIFQNNNFTRDENTFETALVGSLSQQGAKAGGIILERTCFLNNSVFGAYPVRGEGMENDTDFLVSIDTYVDEASIGDSPLCDGFAIYNVTAEQKEVLKCVEPGSSFCQILAPESPTSGPLAPGPTTTPLPPPCVSDLSTIFDAEVYVPPGGLDLPREYVLCPNQEYVTKIVREGVDASQVPGQLALFVRSGATVKCGFDGALSNNCTITAGTFGASIRYLPQFDSNYPKRLNARVQGITFDGLESPLQIRGYNEGEIVFEDCLFTGTRSDSPFILAGNEEAIPEGPDNPTNNPSFTQCDLSADPSDFNITFLNTKFENNEQLVSEDPSVFTTHFLLTTCPGQTLVFTDCIFQNNNFSRDKNTFETALIGSLSQQGAKAGGIILERTCFLNNSILGAYPVRGESTGNDTNFLVSTETYVDESSIGDTPLCEGFAIYNATAEEKEVLNCVEPGSSSCQSLATETPASAPPTSEPTSTPLAAEPTTISLTPSCVDDLSVIFNAEVGVPPEGKDSPREYILCPNQDYITKIVRDGVDPAQVPGQLALFLRSGATVKCGDDGALANNCRITGGTFGASIRYLFQFDSMYPKALNARMQGITFDGLESPLQIRGYNDGEIVFEDCLFTGTRSSSPFILAGNEEVIPEGPDNPASNPSLTRCDLMADPSDFNVTFVNTTFENNEQLIAEFPSVFTTHLLVTTCPGQTLVFTDCIFQENDFTRDENTAETALVGSLSQKGAKAGGIILERTCFLNNKVSGAYPVRGESIENDTDFLISMDTYVDEASIGANFLCEGFVVYDVTAEEKVVLNCVEPGSSFCQLLPTDVPTSETLAPEEPTTAPPTSVASGGGTVRLVGALLGLFAATVLGTL